MKDFLPIYTHFDLNCEIGEYTMTHQFRPTLEPKKKSPKNVWTKIHVIAQNAHFFQVIKVGVVTRILWATCFHGTSCCIVAIVVTSTGQSTPLASPERVKNRIYGPTSCNGAPFQPKSCVFMVNHNPYGKSSSTWTFQRVPNGSVSGCQFTIP